MRLLDSTPKNSLYLILEKKFQVRYPIFQFLINFTVNEFFKCGFRTILQGEPKKIALLRFLVKFFQKSPIRGIFIQFLKIFRQKTQNYGLFGSPCSTNLSTNLFLIIKPFITSRKVRIQTDTLITTLFG
jgi:hypothetical protein